MAKLFAVFLNYFFRGLLVVIPFVVTCYVIYQLFFFIDGLLARQLGPYLPQYGLLPGLGLVTLVVLVTLLGFCASSLIGRRLSRWFETWLDRAPLVNTLYSAIKDLLSAFVGKEKRFNQPVLVRLNDQTELQRIGFVTRDGSEVPGLAADRVSVYLPHAYAWSGNLVVVPRQNVTALDCDAVEAMKFVVSAGISGDLRKNSSRKRAVR